MTLIHEEPRFDMRSVLDDDPVVKADIIKTYLGEEPQKITFRTVWQFLLELQWHHHLIYTFLQSYPSYLQVRRVQYPADPYLFDSQIVWVDTTRVKYPDRNPPYADDEHFLLQFWTWKLYYRQELTQEVLTAVYKRLLKMRCRDRLLAGQRFLLTREEIVARHLSEEEVRTVRHDMQLASVSVKTALRKEFVQLRRLPFIR